MKKHILTILIFGLIIGAMFASVQTAYAESDTAGGPEGCIAFTSSEPFTVSLGDSEKGNTWDGTVQYSTDGTSWQEYTAGTELSAASISSGYSVFFRGEGNKYISSYKKYSSFTLTGSDISCVGNIGNLLDHTAVEGGTDPTMGQYAFAFLFYECRDLITAPALPATTLAASCYYDMFENCISLTEAPELPATTLADYCYYEMFDYCTSLTKAPELPAVTLTEECYDGMFSSCSSLTTAPKLPATTLAKRCYYSMFSDCTSLTKAPELPATTLAPGCYKGMFSGCSNLTIAPELPAQTLSPTCYMDMFRCCTSLIMPPLLPAKTLVESCYFAMFYKSGVRLSEKKGLFNGVFYGIPYRIPKEGTGNDAGQALYEMFSETAGQFTGTPELNKTHYLPCWSGSGTEDTPFVISNTADWDLFADLVKDGFSMEGLFFKLEKDIEVTTMVGANGKPFSGSFDGDGHTLTFNPTTVPAVCAPFAYAKNAEFKNLKIAGTINTNQQKAAGLVGYSEGRAKVTNCRSSITIDSGVKGDGTHGGFIAVGGADFEGCVFDGKLLGTETILCGGFLGWANPQGECSFKDCLFAPQELTLREALEPFCRNATATTPIENCYYTKNIDRTQGKAIRSVTADEGITVSSETAAYNVSGITAYKTGLTYGGTYYAGVNDTVAVTIPSDAYLISASAGTLTGAGTAYTLTMPDEDVHLTLRKAADTPVDPDIPVVNTAKIRTEGNFTKKQMTIVFPADASVDNYLIQYRLAGKTSWSSGWSGGKGTYIVKGLKKYSLCEFRIAGFEKQADGSWIRGNWSKVFYRYMNAVPLKTIKAAKKKITVTWKKDPKASGYQIKYSLKKDMSGAKTITVNGKSKTKYTIKKLKSGKKYYIKVRPVKTKSGKKYLGILDKTKAKKAK